MMQANLRDAIVEDIFKKVEMGMTYDLNGVVREDIEYTGLYITKENGVKTIMVSFVLLRNRNEEYETELLDGPLDVIVDIYNTLFGSI